MLQIRNPFPRSAEVAGPEFMPGQTLELEGSWARQPMAVWALDAGVVEIVAPYTLAEVSAVVVDGLTPAQAKAFGASPEGLKLESYLRKRFPSSAPKAAPAEVVSK